MRNSITPLNLSQPFSIPFYSSNISAGYPSVADEYMEDPLDLNQYLIPKLAYTFLYRMGEEMMRNVGIYHNSILLVDRSILPASGKIVVAEYEGNIIVRRFYKNREDIAKPL